MLLGGLRAGRSRSTTCSARAGCTSCAVPRERLRDAGHRPGGRGQRRGARARPARPRSADPDRRPRRDRRRAPDRPGAGPDATPRLRRRPGLRALPHGRPLLGVPGTAGHPARRRATRAAAGAARTTRRGRCPVCGHRGLRAPVVGDARTAEELGRSFPSTPVRTSSSGQTVLAEVGPQPAIVVATPGAEPVAEGGYAAVVLLDAWLMLARPDLRTEEEAVRRWANAIGLVRPGGRAVAVGDPAHPGAPGAGALGPRRASPPARPAERASAHLPPASRLATITGEPGRRRRRAHPAAPPPEATETLGPVPGRDRRRAAHRGPRPAGPGGGALARPHRELQRVRSARKLDAVRVQVDPQSL